MIFLDAKEGDEMQGTQLDEPSAQEDVAVVEVHATEATEGAVGGEQDYPLEDDLEDEEDEEEEMQRLLDEEEKKKDPDFNQIIDE